MSLLDVILLAIALAMDCFAVSIVSGVIMRQTQWGTILRIAFLFGFFQAMMPLIGWLGFSIFLHTSRHSTIGLLSAYWRLLVVG